MNDMNRGTPALPEKLRQWLGHAVAVGASDLHLIAGYPPVLRLHGDLIELPGPPLDGARDARRARLSVPAGSARPAARSRRTSIAPSISRRRGQSAASAPTCSTPAVTAAPACASCPTTIPDFEWAGFPPELADRLALLLDGLVIVTGATGSGKTTTLAMIVNLLNQAGGYRIITVEEPVEYLFPAAANSVVTQREVGSDVLTFADGLKYGLAARPRRDPGRRDPRPRDGPDGASAPPRRATWSSPRCTRATPRGRSAATPTCSRRTCSATSAHQLAAEPAGRRQPSGCCPTSKKGAKRHLALEVLWNTTPSPAPSAPASWRASTTTC